MLSYFRQFVNEPSPRPSLKGRGGLRIWLIWANAFLVFFLILFSNFSVLPVKNVGDFLFFAVIVLLFSLYRPGWAFLFFVGTIALENVNLAPKELGLAVRPYQLLGAASLIAVVIRYFTKRLSFALPKWNWIDTLILVFASSGFVSALASSISKGVAIKQSVVVFSFVALYFLTRIFIQEFKDLKKIIPYFLSSSVVVILFGIWQNWRFVRGLSNFEVMPGRPNATFAEADWAGIYLVFLLSVVYSLITYFNKVINNSESGIFNFQFSIFKQFSITKLQNFKFNQNSKFKIQNLFLYLILTAVYILLILTVARSAWLGAGAVSVLFFVFCVWYYFKNKNSKILWIPAFTGMTLVLAILIIKVFGLTNFELGNRIQSTGSGLQEITISCLSASKIDPELVISDAKELEQYGCRHINLEEIESEESMGNFVARVKRNDPNVNIRAEIYQSSWEQIKAHPILGIGWGNISQILGTDDLGHGLNASNIFLEVWLGAGLIGFLSFLIILGNIVLRIFNFQFSILKQFSKSNDSILKLDNSDLNQDSKFKIKNFSAWNLFLMLSLFAIVVPNLFNSGIMLGFLWVYLAIVQIKQ